MWDRSSSSPLSLSFSFSPLWPAGPLGEHGLERRWMALALQADCFTSDLSQLIIADVMSGSVPLDASTSISGGWPSWRGQSAGSCYHGRREAAEGAGSSFLGEGAMLVEVRKRAIWVPCRQPPSHPSISSTSVSALPSSPASLPAIELPVAVLEPTVSFSPPPPPLQLPPAATTLAPARRRSSRAPRGRLKGGRGEEEERERERG
uniref:Uncharacterized protein n=1 Tax=Oryza sativa subsp. japonica TaxID=39947 RepID=Q6AUB8_ORYSJ|nr:hypothetical protein [Oryza sativa Japonica Group]